MPATFDEFESQAFAIDRDMIRDGAFLAEVIAASNAGG